MPLIEHDPVTGTKKVSRFAIIATIVIIALVGGTLWVYFSLLAPPASDVRTRGKGGASNDIVAKDILHNTAPESLKKQEEMSSYTASLGIENSKQRLEQDQKQSAAIMDRVRRENAPKPASATETNKNPEPSKKREARPLFNDGLISSLSGSAVAEKYGIPEPATGAGSSSDSKGEVYLPLNMRQMIAAQKEGEASGTNSAQGGEASGDNIPVFHEVKPTAAGAQSSESKPKDGTGNGRSAIRGAEIPVNILPPYTLSIPVRLMNNFIVVGKGADSAQTIIAQVDQDVYFRNRLQLPKGCRFIGMSGGVRDMDMVDISFFALQFPDGTQVNVKGQAYAPYDPAHPESYGMRGIIGEYEEPPLWSQLAPILISGVQGYSQSNFDRLGRSGVRIDGTTGQPLAIETTEKDRLFGAASSATDKLVSIVMENLNRYRPRVRVRMGQPVVIVLDDYVDLSKRSLMGFQNPMLASSSSGAKEDAKDLPLSAAEGEGMPNLSAKVKGALGSGISEADIQKALEWVRNGAGGLKVPGGMDATSQVSPGSPSPGPAQQKR